MNCDPPCILNPWKIGMWMIIKVEAAALGLINYGDCINDFKYRMGTCWHDNGHSLTQPDFSICGGECCVAIYEICKRMTTAGPTYEIRRLLDDFPVSEVCTDGCTFVNCNSSLPSPWDVTAVDPGQPISVGYPKMGVLSSTEQNSIKIQPNPTSENINIQLQFQEAGQYTMFIYNMEGNQIYKQDLNVSSNLNMSFDMNTKAYMNGAYNVIISNSVGEIMNSKFVKIK